MRWAASDVSPSSHLAFHIPNTCRVLFVLCCVLGLRGLLLCCVWFPVLQVFWNPEFSAQLDDRQGLIASSAMQQKKKRLESLVKAARRIQAEQEKTLEDIICRGCSLRLINYQQGVIHEQRTKGDELEAARLASHVRQSLTEGRSARDLTQAAKSQKKKGISCETTTRGS